MENYLFEKEIRVFGMRRSGNAAVNNFIVRSFPRGVVVFINNSDLSFRKYGPFPKRQKRYAKKVFKYFLNGTEHMPITDINVCLKRKYCYYCERQKWAKHYGKWAFAKSDLNTRAKSDLTQDKYNLVIVRSPHNYLASVLKFPHNKMKYIFTGNNRYLEFTQLWIQYAEEALGITNYIPSKIVVLFDKFVSDSYYRKSISDALGIPYVYSAIRSSAYGQKSRYLGVSKSSFDGNGYMGSTNEMMVLDRWKYLIDPGEEVWWTLDECKEKLMIPKVVSYTKELFGVDLKEVLS